MIYIRNPFASSIGHSSRRGGIRRAIEPCAEFLLALRVNWR